MSQTKSNMCVNLETADELKAGLVTVADTTEAAIIDSSVPVKHFVRVKALASNSTNMVYLGGVGVTTTTGYQLAAGEFVDIQVSDVNLIHAIGSTSGLKVSWLAH